MPLPKQSATRPLDIIIGKGILTTEALLSELRDKLASRVARYRTYRGNPLAFASLEELIEEFEPLIAENIFSTDVAAWIQSIREVEKKLPSWAFKKFSARTGLGGFITPPIDPPTFNPLSIFGDAPREPLIRFPVLENAVNSLMRRNIVTRDVFDAMTSQERNNAFTIAREMRTDTIGRIRTALAETIDDGASLENFKSKIKGELESSFIGPWHVETVYRTNAQTAFNDGHRQIADDPIVSEIFPYKEWLAIHDARTRKTHLQFETLGLSGTGVYRRDDPFWSVYDIPAGYNCRCTTNLLTIEQAAERGVVEAKRWLRTGVKPTLESRLPYIPFPPEPGFIPGRRVAA